MNGIGRLGFAIAAALIALGLGPPASAVAAGPNITVEAPSGGSRTNQAPLVSGSTDDTLDSISLSIFEGPNASGNQVFTETTLPVGTGWSVQAPSLAEGSYTAVAGQVNSSTGEPGISPAVTFTIDRTAPAVSLNAVASPTKAASFGGGAGTAAGDLPTITVTVRREGSTIAVATTQASGGKWTYSPASLGDGAYTVAASQSDEAGNSETSPERAFTVDTTAPEISLSPLPSVTATPMPTFGGKCCTAEGDEAVKVTIFAGTEAEGAVVGHLGASASGTNWSATASKALSDGTYTARAEQVDWAGNQGFSEPSTFTVKTTGPAVTMESFPSHYTNNSTPSFSGGLGTAAHDLPDVTLEIYEGTAASGKPAQSFEAPHGGTSWSAGPAKHLADGTYTAVAKQLDEAHNVGLSIARTFTVDTVAPAPMLLSVPDKSTGLETVSGVAGITKGDRHQVTAELFPGTAVEASSAYETITVNDNPEDGAWSTTFANLGGGEYTVRARQSDEAGNAGQSPTSSFTVTVPPVVTPIAPPPPTPPVASFTWVPANPTVGQSVSLVSNSTDASSAIGAFAWDVAGSGAFVAGGPAITTTFAATGAHVVRLQVTDGNGLTSIAAQTIAVAASAMKLMQPFPIVRIAGSETSSGVRVKLLTVQAPPTTTVAVACKGHGCKTKSESRVAKASSQSKSKAGAITLAFPRFERSLQAGAVLQIRVSKAGEIGKYTSFTIRRKKLPARVDACLRPPSSSPSPCPST